MGQTDLRGQGCRHQRILEETAGVTQHRWIREFFAADTANRLADIAGRGLVDTLFSQALAHRTVVQVQPGDAIKDKAHPQDHPAPGLLLEQAVAIGEVAVFQAEIPQLAGLAIESGQAGEHVLDLDPIGADVLHRRCSHRARDQAEVLQPRQTLSQRPLDERMPGFPCFCFNHHVLAVITQLTDTTGCHAQHQRPDIGGQQQIAAAADHQQRHLMLARIGQRLTHIGIAFGLGEQLCANVHAKAVERLERNLRLHEQCHKRPFNSITSASQACSIRSSTCSKPCSPS